MVLCGVLAWRNSSSGYSGFDSALTRNKGLIRRLEGDLDVISKVLQSIDEMQDLLVFGAIVEVVRSLGEYLKRWGFTPQKPRFLISPETLRPRHEHHEVPPPVLVRQRAPQGFEHSRSGSIRVFTVARRRTAEPGRHERP
jgi:hypothetical protein